MDYLSFSEIRLNAMACVTFPMYGFAMTVSERYLRTIISHLEEAIKAAGLRDDDITVRMARCPNGCARPYLDETAFVDKAPNTYNVYLDGEHNGNRLNKLYKESLKEEEILNKLNLIIKLYTTERLENKPSSDFVIHTGYVKRTITGTGFHKL